MAENDRKFSILDHLEELRKRLFFALMGLVICLIISFFFTENIILFLSRPAGGLENLQAIEVTENVGVFMKVALLSGFTLSLPWILFQIMKFVIPGLTRTEKKWLFLSIPFATLLFILGIAFAFYVMLPSALPILTQFLGITTTIRVKSYIDFIINLMFWIGISFELPLIVFILARLGIVNAKSLLNGWRYALIAMAILAALITPTVDPINMAIFMLPLFLLYLLSILLAKLAQNKS